jgi:hypothetical protein
MWPVRIHRDSSTTEDALMSDGLSSLRRSSELLGDLRLEETIDRIVAARFLPDSAVIYAALDTPDFDIRTNGRAALKVLIRMLRSTTLDGMKEQTVFYPNEFPKFIDGQNQSAACPECSLPLYG